MKKDVMEAACDFLGGSLLPRFYSSSYIVLIPKVENPQGFDKFQPISLCSVAYKIFSKILVKRMASLLPKIIAHEQGAFLTGRTIFYNITLTQEIVHSLNRKVHGRNVVVKVDMAKAYDRVDWRFLLHVLRSFGFPHSFCSLISECISMLWFSIMMNGTTKGFFKPSRGLRQGDPISPYLFIIIEEVLTRLLRKKFEDGCIGSFSHPHDAPLVSHLLYVDDIVVFANGSKRSMKALMDTFQLYEKWTGQVINKDKSAIFFAKHCGTIHKHEVLRLSSFREGSFPIIYLGVPVVVGRLTAHHLHFLVEKVQKKIASWKMQLLSQGGRLVLLRHVLSCMATHLLSVLSIPKSVFKTLNS